MDLDSLETARINGETVRLKVEGQTWRGEGLAVFGDVIVTIHGARTGETIDCTIARQRGRNFMAVSRFDTDCPQFHRCPGCQLWRWTPEEERAFKSQNIVEIIAKYSRFQVALSDIEFVDSASAYAGNYRRRGRLNVRGEDLSFANSLTETPIDASLCRVLTSAAANLCSRISLAWSSLDPEYKRGLVAIEYAALDRDLVRLTARGDLSRNSALETAHAFGELLDLDVAVVHQGKDLITPIVGIVRESPIVRASLGAWFHPAKEPSEMLYRHLSEMFQPGESVLELGCGIGTLSIVAATNGAKVVGMDSDRQAIDLAAGNADDNQLDLEFICIDWTRGTRKFAASGARFDTAVVNPMREPVGEALRLLPSLGVERVIYLAPSPTAGAKDMDVLADVGFEMQRTAAVNLYPRTYHTLLLAELVQKK